MKKTQKTTRIQNPFILYSNKKEVSEECQNYINKITEDKEYTEEKRDFTKKKQKIYPNISKNIFIKKRNGKNLTRTEELKKNGECDALYS